MLRIAFVDDEPNVLKGISRALMSMRGAWEMVFCGSGAEALAQMREKPFDIVVTDMRMPEMDGAELLSRVRALSPATVRIILSGYAESDAILRTVGPAHIYLAKPCSAEALRQAVLRQIALRALLEDPALRALLAGLGNLPSLPDVYARLQEELISANSSPRGIAAIVAEDVAMTAELMRIANSAFFAASGHVTSLLSAVSLLGVEVIQTLVLRIGVFRQFSGKPEQAQVLEGMTRHSLIAAEIAQHIVVMEGGDDATAKSARIAGMLSDIGRIVLFDAYPQRYRALMADGGGLPLHLREQQAFGAAGTLIGAYLLGLWGFSDQIVEAVAHCQTPSACPGRDNLVLTALHGAFALGPPFSLNGGEGGLVMCPLDQDYLNATGCAPHLRHWRDVLAP